MSSAKGGYVYIMSNRHRNVFYIGVTAYLYSRTTAHKNGEGCFFTKKYNCHDLVYWEFHGHILSAIEREKRLKKWKRVWKIRLIQDLNPFMKDLYSEVEDCD